MNPPTEMKAYFANERKHSSKASLYPLHMKTAERIEVLLRARGVKDRAVRIELAAVCGISPQAVGQWWTTTKRISPDYLAKIAAKYKTTMEWLVTGKGNMDALVPPPTLDLQIDELISALYARRNELSAEQYAILETLLDDLQSRARSRIQKFLQSTNE